MWRACMPFALACARGTRYTRGMTYTVTVRGLPVSCASIEDLKQLIEAFGADATPTTPATHGDARVARASQSARPGEGRAQAISSAADEVFMRGILEKLENGPSRGVMSVEIAGMLNTNVNGLGPVSKRIDRILDEKGLQRARVFITGRGLWRKGPDFSGALAAFDVVPKNEGHSAEGRNGTGETPGRIDTPSASSGGVMMGGWQR
jgi:hypothetical protein